MSAIKSHDFNQLKKLANEGIDVSTVADFVFNEQKMNEPIMWKPDSVSAILSIVSFNLYTLNDRRRQLVVVGRRRVTAGFSA